MKHPSHAPRRLRVLLAVAAAAAASSATSLASAQMAHIPDNDWRQPDRHDALQGSATKPSFALEIRFGTYLPNVDSEFSATPGPFTKVFGTDCSTAPTSTTKPSVSPRLYFGLEGDFMPVRIPYLGMFGLGLGWGYTKFSNYAQFTTKTATSATSTSTTNPSCSAETTSLTIMPMHASLVLRIDELMRRTGIPLVPYGKAGAGFSFWRATTDAGTEQCSSKSSDPAAAAACATSHNGIGLTPSLHFALGGMIALNFIDPRSSARLDETTGIHHAYIFGEWYSDTLTLSSKVMHVGASSWVAGLAVDL